MLLSYYDFFCGGGMCGYGLGDNWQCLFANDFDKMKVETYRINRSHSPELICRDINEINSVDLPGVAHLAWASFPCQDLSLAGNCLGLNGPRSGSFWTFWRLMEELDVNSRAPRIIVLENVCGAITSRGGVDFTAIADAFAKRPYRFGAVVIDAEKFVPQSRERVFFVAIHYSLEIPERLTTWIPNGQFHSRSLIKVCAKMKRETAERWIWWNLPSPVVRKVTLKDILEGDNAIVAWDTAEQTSRLLRQMDSNNLSKVKAAMVAEVGMVGTIYKRTRLVNGVKTQRAEVRFDDVAGCLRTPAGGSSRQTVIMVEKKSVLTRLLTAREAARLMGLPDSYKLPCRYSDAYHLAGDGVVVPVVRFIAQCILEPILMGRACP